MKVVALAFSIFAAVTCVNGITDDALYNVGMSKVDITGPVAQNHMMGYADIMQRATGLLNRLYARAFVVEQDGKRVAIVHCDIHSIPLLLHNQVIEKVKDQVGERYNMDNVMIHAQHTHASPAGLHTFYIYAFSGLGFTQIHFDLVVDQIVLAIKLADADLQPRRMYFTTSQTHECGVNRSPEAYDANPEDEKAKYKSNHNDEMALVKITAPDNADDLHGLWSFFAVHTTSLPGFSTVISGDNKGYAQWIMEKSRGDDFIAAFFESEAGDISPNTIDNGDGTFTGVFREDFVRSAQAIGQCQVDAAESAIASPSWEPIKGNIISKKSFFDFQHYKVQGDENRSTCPAVSGINMFAGTEDGRGPFYNFPIIPLREGNSRFRHHPVAQFLGRKFFNDVIVPDDIQKCQEPKVPFLVTGVEDYKRSPPVLPLQLAIIGSFAIAAIPFEVTTMSGRRIANTVQNAVKDRQLAHVAIAADSNAYSGYLTTREEYRTQHYEGASTHFGQYQLEAVQDMLTNIVKSDKPRGAFNGVPDPLPFKSFSVWTDVGTVHLDSISATSLPPWQSLGGVHQDVASKSSFARGQVASAKFWCARPLNSQILVESFCDVEQEQHDGEWKIVLRDHDWNVRFLWHNKFLIYSICTCQWVIPKDSPDDRTGPLPQGPRSFRLRMRGMVEDTDGTPRLYTGVSSPFKVSNEIVSPINVSVLYIAGIPNEVIIALLVLVTITLTFHFLFKTSRAKPFPSTKTKHV